MCSFKDLLVYRLSNDSQLRTSLMVGGFRSEALLELLGLGHSQLRTSLMVGGFRSEGIVGIIRPRPNVELFMRRTKLRGVSKTRGLSFL